MIENCVVARNAARVGGGVAVAEGAYPHIVNSLLTENRAPSGAGLYCEVGSADIVVLNTILWANEGDEILVEAGDTPTVHYSNVDGGYAGEGNMDVDPLLRSFGSLDLVPGPGSACIDAGNPGIEDGVWDSDPRWPRWYSNGPRSDMGAYGGPQNAGWIEP